MPAAPKPGSQARPNSATPKFYGKAAHNAEKPSFRHGGGWAASYTSAMRRPGPFASALGVEHFSPFQPAL